MRNDGLRWHGLAPSGLLRGAHGREGNKMSPLLPSLRLLSQLLLKRLPVFLVNGEEEHASRRVSDDKLRHIRRELAIRYRTGHFEKIPGSRLSLGSHVPHLDYAVGGTGVETVRG